VNAEKSASIVSQSNLTNFTIHWRGLLWLAAMLAVPWIEWLLTIKP